MTFTAKYGIVYNMMIALIKENITWIRKAGAVFACYMALKYIVLAFLLRYVALSTLVAGFFIYKIAATLLDSIATYIWYRCRNR